MFSDPCKISSCCKILVRFPRTFRIIDWKILLHFRLDDESTMSGEYSSVNVTSSSSNNRGNLNTNYSAAANQQSKMRNLLLPAGRDGGEKRALNDNQLPPAKKLQFNRTHSASASQSQRATDASAEIFPDDDDDILLLAADIAMEDAAPEHHSDTPPLAGSMAHGATPKISAFDAASVSSNSCGSSVRHVGNARPLARPFTYLASHLKRACPTDPATTICVKVGLKYLNFHPADRRDQENPHQSQRIPKTKPKQSMNWLHPSCNDAKQVVGMRCILKGFFPIGWSSDMWTRDSCDDQTEHQYRQGFISTIRTKLEAREGKWRLGAMINDGSAGIDVDFTHQVGH